MKKGIRKNQDGFTLVELVVTFAMIAIFMTAAIQIMGSATRIHDRMDNMTKSEVIADTLMENVVGEISSASSAVIPESGAENAACFIENGDSFDTLYFYDKNLNHAQVFVDVDGYLLFRYQNTDITGEIKDWHWYLGNDAMMNNKITKLKFDPVDDLNVIKATMELTNEHTGFRYEISKMIKCYNLSTGTIVKS